MNDLKSRYNELADANKALNKQLEDATAEAYQVQEHLRFELKAKTEKVQEVEAEMAKASAAPQTRALRVHPKPLESSKLMYPVRRLWNLLPVAAVLCVTVDRLTPAPLTPPRPHGHLDATRPEPEPTQVRQRSEDQVRKVRADMEESMSLFKRDYDERIAGLEAQRDGLSAQLAAVLDFKKRREEVESELQRNKEVNQELREALEQQKQDLERCGGGGQRCAAVVVC